MIVTAKRIVGPTATPLSVNDAISYVKAEADNDIEDVARIVCAATDWCERFCRQQFCTATWRQTLSAFPPYASDDPRRPRFGYGYGPGGIAPYGTDIGVALSFDRIIGLRWGPLQSVNSLQYVDPSGATQTMDPSLYEVDADSNPGRIAEAPGAVWPPTQSRMRAVMIEHIAGYGAAAAVPATIVQAIALLTAHWWLNREAVVIGAMSREVELSLKSALTPFRTATQTV